MNYDDRPGLDSEDRSEQVASRSWRPVSLQSSSKSQQRSDILWCWARSGTGRGSEPTSSSPVKRLRRLSCSSEHSECSGSRRRKVFECFLTPSSSSSFAVFVSPSDLFESCRVGCLGLSRRDIFWCRVVSFLRSGEDENEDDDSPEGFHRRSSLLLPHDSSESATPTREDKLLWNFSLHGNCAILWLVKGGFCEWSLVKVMSEEHEARWFSLRGNGRRLDLMPLQNYTWKMDWVRRSAWWLWWLILGSVHRGQNFFPFSLFSGYEPKILGKGPVRLYGSLPPNFFPWQTKIFSRWTFPFGT